MPMRTAIKIAAAAANVRLAKPVTPAGPYARDHVYHTGKHHAGIYATRDTACRKVRRRGFGMPWGPTWQLHARRTRCENSRIGRKAALLAAYGAYRWLARVKRPRLRQTRRYFRSVTK